MRVELVGTEAAEGLVVEAAEAGGEWTWSVANETGAPMDVDRVALRWRLVGDGPMRMFINGWQSWSAAGGAEVGRDEDPARRSDALAVLRDGLYADPALPAPGELRSEVVTALADDHDQLCLGFDGADRHDGTFRVLGDQLRAEAYLGGATLAPGERRELHTVRLAADDDLAAWAGWAGARSGARTAAPFQVGWCSWYHYFHDVTEDAFRANLALAADWPFDLFQLDDGFQSAIGDWLTTNEKFPSPLERLADSVAAAGLQPGLWIAPFLVSPDSEVAREHPDWIAQRKPGRPLIGAINPGWGGVTWVLDTTHPEVQAHLESLARSLVGMGWTYLKLDFTYAPSFGGQWHDPSLTPAQRVRAGYDAIRRGAGESAFLLGCGAPLGPCIGVVDGMRIGPDVAPYWLPSSDELGFVDTAPATVNAWRNTLARSFMHRKLWLNDPDCLMLRTTDTRLTEPQIETWAQAVALSGGMALVSDDLALLPSGTRSHLESLLATGRAADALAVAGTPPRCPDLLTAWTPTTLASTSQLTADPDTGTSTLT